MKAKTRTKPITVAGVLAAKTRQIPSGVFAVFNTLIVENWVSANGSAVVFESQAVERIAKRCKVSKDKIWCDGYLNIEDAYRFAGWQVTCDSSSGARTYTFKPVIRA